MVHQKLVSPKAIEFINKYFFICTPPKEVYASMEQMRQKMVTLFKEGKDPIDIASFVHMETGRIHPFCEANGRIARIYMNIILMQAGHQPIAFASEKDYTQALKNPKDFTQLVRNLSRMFDYEAQVDRELEKC
jgi:Fic family protein